MSEIIGMGSDITECARVGKMILAHGEDFLRRVYTDREIAFCQSRKRATEFFAGHWSAKEAVARAWGEVLGNPIPWTDLEVRRFVGGRSEVRVRGLARDFTRSRGIGRILVSIAHCRSYATAHAIAFGIGPQRREPAPNSPSPENVLPPDDDPNTPKDPAPDSSDPSVPLPSTPEEPLRRDADNGGDIRVTDDPDPFFQSP